MSAVLNCLRQLCQIDSYLKRDEADKVIKDERQLATVTHSILEGTGWFKAVIEEYQDEEDADCQRCNVLALDCAPQDVQLLIVGHLDTVRPSDGWTEEHDSIRDNKYFNLGAVDTKASIAACLEAIMAVGPTRGVAVLLYSDEEYYFAGMKDFVARHPEIKPAYVLSLCGANAKMLRGCRGCIEMRLVLRGKSAHASRPHLGTNAISHLAEIISDLKRELDKLKTPLATSVNLAYLHGGTFNGLAEKSKRLLVDESPNKVPDAAEAVIDVRPGGLAVNAKSIETILERLVAQRCQADTPVKLYWQEIKARFDNVGYLTPEDQIDLFLRHFADVVGQEDCFEDPAGFGYIDVAMLQDRGAAMVCLSPLGGNHHSADEWVDLTSADTYFQGLCGLLGEFKINE